MAIPVPWARVGLITAFLLTLWLGAIPAVAAPYAAMVIDARNGKVLHSRNADTRLHPASLTKMMTLYIAFQAVERGEISLDTMVTISRHAAAEPPSKLGLRSGQRIKFRYLIRAAAVKSANDAATAIGEAISGSEAAFARRMNRTAKAMGMTRTTFKNAHGLTESGHLSTARDMTTLGRHVFYDFPEYYNLFSRRSTHAGLRTVNNTNRRLLANYRGADGIKTGYTRAAGFNLVASAERGSERIIATVFGGNSTASRNARVAELLDMGFKRAPSRVAVRKPAPPGYQPSGMASRTVRASGLVTRSLRPVPRPLRNDPAAEALLLSMQSEVEKALDELRATEMSTDLALPPTENLPALKEAGAAQPTDLPTTIPPPEPRPIELAFAPPEAPPVEAPQVVTRMSTSGGRHWAITVGDFGTRHQAERVLLQTALLELATLDQALRKVVPHSTGFRANFVGLSEEQADLACRRLMARNMSCQPLGPG